MSTREKFLPNTFYHIYNHAVGTENLFKSHENYLFFLNKYGQHLSSVFKTFAYCLMPNHFHLLIQVRDEHTLSSMIAKPEEEIDFHKFIMQKLSNFLNGYAKAFNNSIREEVLFSSITPKGRKLRMILILLE